MYNDVVTKEEKHVSECVHMHYLHVSAGLGPGSSECRANIKCKSQHKMNEFSNVKILMIC